MIRSANIQDATSIAQIHIDSWRAAYRGIVPDAFLDDLDIKQKTKKWSTILAESQSKTFVMESEGKITAWLSYGRCRDDGSEGFGEIWALYVSPEKWRFGHGSALMRFAEEMARKSRTSDLVLWVFDQNLLGKTFYEKVGFVPDGMRKKAEIGNVILEGIRYHKKI